MERDIRHQVWMRTHLLVADDGALLGKKGLGCHAARQDAVVKECRRRRSDQFAGQGIDMYVLIKVHSQVMQIHRQTCGVRARQRRVPVIERAQIGLDIL